MILQNCICENRYKSGLTAIKVVQPLLKPAPEFALTQQRLLLSAEVLPFDSVRRETTLLCTGVLSLDSVRRETTLLCTGVLVVVGQHGDNFGGSVGHVGGGGERQPTVQQDLGGRSCVVP